MKPNLAETIGSDELAPLRCGYCTERLFLGEAIMMDSDGDFRHTRCDVLWAAEDRAACEDRGHITDYDDEGMVMCSMCAEPMLREQAWTSDLEGNVCHSACEARVFEHSFL